MPLPDNLLPTHGTNPWSAHMASAWTVLRTFVNGLESTLSGKAATSHSHTTAQVTGLDTALAGKAASTHTHTAAQVSDATTVGRALMTTSSAAAARTTLGTGTPLSAIYSSFNALPTNPVAGTIYVTMGD